jgi:hypothetical protein
MKIFISIVLIHLSLFSVNAQNKFMIGGWKTTNTNKVTRITTGNQTIARLYKISSTALDNYDTEFQVIVDGQTITSKFQEGSSIYVHGKEILIKQISDGDIYSGLWEVVANTRENKDKLAWRAETPPNNGKVLVASFLSPKDFVISLGFQSTNCTRGTGRMIVIVDGVTIKDANGDTLEFLEGSSLFGKGKLIEVQLTGVCTSNYSFVGNLTF